jgi:hypothetical protein
MKYQSKGSSAAVEAHRVPPAGEYGLALNDFMEWADNVGLDYCSSRDECLTYDNGTKHAKPGDWIIKQAWGDFYTYSPEAFNFFYQDGE